MKDNTYTATVTRRLRSSQNTVWRALTSPELIKTYFFGTEAVSSWHVGSPIIFRGEWEGKPYEDKGTILENIEGKMLRYNYWSSFSGTEDKPENYAVVTYEVIPEGDETILIISQDSIASSEAKDHSEKNWNMILDGLEKLVQREGRQKG